jgi:hypothetical protein
MAVGLGHLHSRFIQTLRQPSFENAEAEET